MRSREMRIPTVQLAIYAVISAMACTAISAKAVAEDAEDLALKVANPVAALISVPIQTNYDWRVGPADKGSRFTANVQPVIPIGLNADWNVISRTIVPVVHQRDIYSGAGTQFGLGDTVQSLFLSPAVSDVIWGVGPVFLLPTSTDPLLGTEKWGAGPTAAALIQHNGWTVGALANHIWSFAGDESRADVNTSFIQPFVSYTTSNAWTFTLQTETSYDWTSDQWSIPVAAMASKLMVLGTQPVSLSAGLRYWAEAPDGGPEGLGTRLAISFLFPKQ